MTKRGSFPCPNCGEEVPAGAKACPGCGSDESTGWSENAVYDGTDIPDEKDFDYQATLEKEGLAKTVHSRGRIFLFVVTVLLLLIGFVLFFVAGR